VRQFRHKEDVLPVNYKEDVLPVNYKEDVLPVNFNVNEASNIYKKFAKSAMNKTTNQGDVDANTYMENEGAQDDTKRIAVTVLTSERGGRGA
jgi:hypothetical protein